MTIPFPSLPHASIMSITLKDYYKEVEIEVRLKGIPFKGYKSVCSKMEIVRKSSFKYGSMKNKKMRILESKGKELVEDIDYVRYFCEGGTSWSEKKYRACE